MSDTMNHTPTPGSDHYGFTGETRALPDGQVVRQIEAAVDMPDAGIAAGDIGGWVGPEATLMDKAWVSPDAMVIDSATLAGNARLGDSAVLSGSATVDGDAFCAGRSVVTDRAYVGGFARVAGDATVGGQARVNGQATIGGTVSLSGTAHATGDVILDQDESLSEGVHPGSMVADQPSEHVPVTFRWIGGVLRRLSGG